MSSINRLLTLNAAGQWKNPRTIEGCVFETAVVAASDKKASRITVDLNCSVDLFQAFITTPRNSFLFEPTLLGAEVFSADNGKETTILHTKYSGQGVVSARDFCIEVSTGFFPSRAADLAESRSSGAEAGAGASQACWKFIDQLLRETAGGDAVFVSAATSCTAIPTTPAFTRGEVLIHGFIAVGIHRGDSTRLIQISHVDPKGSIPAVALDAVLPDGCKKLSRIKDLCEALSNMVANMKIIVPPAASMGKRQQQQQQAQQLSSETTLLATEAPASSAASVSNSSLAAPGEEARRDTVVGSSSSTGIVTGDDGALSAANSSLSSFRQSDGNSRHIDASIAAPPPFSSTVVSPSLRNSLSRTLALHAKAKWTVVKTLENCLLEETLSNLSDKKAYRISTTLRCTLATLEAFMNDDSNLRKYDPMIDSLEFMADSDAGRVIYSSYKRQSSLITPRDFCTVTGAAKFYGEDVKAEGLGTDHEAAYVIGCISCNAKPEQKGFIRGIIVAFGYVALAAAPTSTTVKLYNIMLVDPCGSIPKWMLDIATADACKKIAAVRRMVEEKQRTNPAAVVPSPLPTPQSSSSTPLPPAGGGAIEAQSPSASNIVPGPSSSSGATALPKESMQVAAAEQQAFFEQEVDEIIANLTKLHCSRGWEESKSIADCRLETLTTTLCDKKAVRVSTEFKCTLQTFLAVMSNVEYVRKYDPGLAVLQPLDSPPFASVLYTAYKSNTKLVTARDFCTMTASKLLSEAEGANAGLYTRGMRAAAFVMSTVNCKDMPEQKDFVRGTIHAYGYIAVAVPPTADRIRVFNVALVDPMGSIPAKIVDAAMGETCKKLDLIRSICMAEEKGGKAHVLKLVTPALASQEQSFPSIDEDPIIRKITRMQQIREWPNQRQMGRVHVQYGPCDANPDVTSYRCSTEFMCTLKTFAAFVASSDNIRRTDQEVEFVRFLEGPPNAVVSHVAYRSSSSVYPSTDFVTLTVSKRFDGSEGSDAGLYTAGITSAAFVSNSINWSVKGLESPAGSSRGTVYYNGLVAIATPPAASRIRVFAFTAVEGKGVKRSDDVRIADCCDRLNALGVQCELLQGQADAQQIQEEVVSEPGVPTEAESTPSAASEVSSETSGSPAMDDVSSCPEASNISKMPVVTQEQRKVLFKMLQLNNRTDWRMSKVVDRCVLEECDVTFCDKKALRITTDVNCTLNRFEEFIADVQGVRKYDPTLEVFEILKQDATSGTITCYSAYKKQSSFVAPRDFCSQVVRVRLPGDVAFTEAGIAGCHEAVVQNAVSVPAKGLRAGFVRGVVHCFGFIATVKASDSTKITLTNIMSVDPCGSIPKWVMDAASGESCKKLAVIRSLCEQI